MSRTIRFVPLLFVLLLFSVACAESVTQLPYELSIMDYTVSGKYTGDIADGKPEGYVRQLIKTDEILPLESLTEIWKKWKQYGLGRKYRNISAVIANYKEQEVIEGKVVNLESKKKEIVNLLKQKINIT